MSIHSVSHIPRCYLWNFSVASIFILTFSNILLTIRLLHKNSDLVPQLNITTQLNNDVTARPTLHVCDEKNSIVAERKSKKIVEKNFISNETHFLREFKIDFGMGRWDAQRSYKLYDNVLIGERYLELSHSYNVTLATQSSFERLWSLVQVAFHWRGPISVGLYAAGNEELNLLILYVYYLQQCFRPVREQIVFHLLLPANNMPTGINLNFTYLQPIECQRMSPSMVLQSLLKLRTQHTVKWRLRNPYPQNHLRNLARTNSQTMNVFLTDVDIIPSYGLADELNEFLNVVQCPGGLCAYVIPTYELDERVSFPRNKSDLLRLSRKGLARPFHEKIFIYNQFATNINRWQQHEDPFDNKLHVSHPVTNFEFFYEPFYVSSDTVPKHDERFLGYGFTRNTQVYEMFVAGYKFLVLSPAFSCHWGLQLKRYRPHWREQQNTLNAKKFEVFKREIYARYNVDPLNMMKSTMKHTQTKTAK